jgi:hypothetical protein
VSLALAVAAVGLHLTALNQFSRGAHTIARAVTLSDSERADARAEASRLSRRGDAIAYVGIGFALASVAFLVVHHRLGLPEPGRSATELNDDIIRDSCA